ncbi:MAG: prolyl oligopeptidase family serine peptidase [Candidatus Marinimicrobia bacterium]|nr:prolyl oligopeptidase family serine peptidase [Candidatus Neomarinimicrobiota bacterium]
MSVKHQRLVSQLVTLLLLFCFLPKAQAEILHLKLPSHALIDSNRVIIATPNSFDVNRAKRYPFIFMLHGWSGDETQWEDDSDLQALCDKYDVLLVLPDGGYDGWWIDTDYLPGRNYDSHLRQELKPWIITIFNGSDISAEQGIMGLSMGGYGSILQALKHPEEYAAASSLSGIMDITRHPDKWGLKWTLGDFTDSPANWHSNNPIDLIRTQNTYTGPALQLICGREDFAFQENLDMAAQLDTLGYAIDFLEDTGTHSHKFWKSHVEIAIKFIVDQFKTK